jgi:[CysO sulfur-carrier protein]-S-L-cysteine hydrolase
VFVPEQGGGWVFSWFGRHRRTGDPGVAARRRLYIPEGLYRRMINHCYEEKPLEACGLLGGVGGHVESGFATDNAFRSPKVYKVDDRQLVQAFQEIQSTRQEIIGIYHSHVETEPVPSQTDIDQATFPEAFYVIVSLRHRRPLVRAWRMVDRTVTEHQVVVVPGAGGTWRDLREAVRAATDPAPRTDIR